MVPDMMILITMTIILKQSIRRATKKAMKKATQMVSPLMRKMTRVRKMSSSSSILLISEKCNIHKTLYTAEWELSIWFLSYVFMPNTYCADA